MNIDKRLVRTIFASALALLLAACSAGPKDMPAQKTDVAPGAPGKKSTWAFSGKTGIGTSFEAYHELQHSKQANTGTVSKVWFSVTKGVLTETMFGLIHEAQLKDLQFIIVGEDFVDIESEDTNSTIEYLHLDASGRPLSLAYRITTTDKDKHYQIVKDIVTDPDRQSLIMSVSAKALRDNISFYIQANPHVANTGSGDRAWGDEKGLYAQDGGTVLHLRKNTLFSSTSVGFFGESDLLKDLTADKKMDWHYSSTGRKTGNVVLSAAVHPSPLLANSDVEFELALGFGATPEQAAQESELSLTSGFSQILKKYNGEGDYIGWEDYLASLDQLGGMYDSTLDGGKLLHTSALVLKAQEDKTHSGALIASLSNPWGDTGSAEQSATGYKAVWPRDFYQCAMALLALGDRETPKVAFKYLEKVQVDEDTPNNKGVGGWFLQKTHVDGTLEWISVQLDQTANPIMLGWKLWKAGVLSDQEITLWYKKMLKPAADFLVQGGRLDIDWNKEEIIPPHTQQERWEEQGGYSPSTLAATIAGLVTAADIAATVGDKASAKQYLAQADVYSKNLEKWTFTTKGTIEASKADGRYYLRITANDNPNDNGKLQDRNGRGKLKESEILDAGFLELVRYGVRSANDSHVLESLDELDSMDIIDRLRLKYNFTTQDGDRVPGWRRYGDDGYGEDIRNGENYAARNGKMSRGQRGRVWPFFTGERGHYEIARAMQIQDAKQRDDALKEIKNTYVKGLEFFANKGLMLPEQVWDGVGKPTIHNFEMGEGTNSATPLAWTHAEYVKLVRSLSDREVWDFYPIVHERYVR